jgi:hypothetical protein
MAYASGLLEALIGVRAPRCYAQNEESDAVVLWLEDLVEDAGGWTLERFGQVAHDLGRFGGAYARGAPLPDWSWLSRRWLAPWVAQAAAGFHTFREELRDPLLSRLYPPEVASVMLALWEARDRILSVLARQRQILSHLDAVPANAILRHGTTYLIDWAFVGLAALGEDLAPLVGGSTMFGGPPPEHLPAIDKVAFPAYVAGLRTSGWDDDPRLVRFVYCAAAALRYCVGPTTWYVCGMNADGTPADVGGIRDLRQRAIHEDHFGLPFTEILRRTAANVRFLALALGVEALNLLPDYERA